MTQPHQSALAAARPGPWDREAECVWYPVELFYGPSGREGRFERSCREEQAKAICALCPVRDECRAFALATDQRYGIWGGMTEEERGYPRRHPSGKAVA